MSIEQLTVELKQLAEAPADQSLKRLGPRSLVQNVLSTLASHPKVTKLYANVLENDPYTVVFADELTAKVGDRLYCESALDRTCLIVDRLFEGYRLMGYDGKLLLDFLYGRILFFCLVSKEVEYLKWKTVSLFCHLMDQEPPKRPTWADEKDVGYIMCGGSWYGWIKSYDRRLKSSDKDKRDQICSDHYSWYSKALSLGMSSLYLKRAMPEVSDEFVTSEVNGWFDYLTTDHPVGILSDGSGMNVDVEKYRYEIKESICEIVDEIFNLRNRPDFQSWHWPSEACHMGSSRKQKGARGFIQRSWIRSSCKTASSMYENTLLAALHEENLVSPLGLKEPFKCRIITKGPPLRYTIGKYIQKALHDVMRNLKTFRLIGETVSSELLDVVIGDLDKDQVYVSGDYKASTDRLDPELSVFTVNEICERWELPSELREIFLEGLVGATIEHDGQRRKQKWGQLMGSPMSFPVLCIVNAAIGRLGCSMSACKERAGKFDSMEGLRRCPMLINGDDILVRMYEHNVPYWAMYCRVAGLEPSVGKNYVSGHFAMINSRVFKYAKVEDNFSEQLWLGMKEMWPYSDNDWQETIIHYFRENYFLSEEVCEDGYVINSHERMVRDYVRAPSERVMAEILPVLAAEVIDFYVQRGVDPRKIGCMSPSLIARTFESRGRTSFWYEGSAGDGHWISRKFEEIPFINLGLLYGTKRSSGKLKAKDIATGFEDLGKRCVELVRGHNQFMKDELVRIFIREHRELLDMAGPRPWFLPPHLGGLGLPTGRPLSEVCTDEQLQAAAIIVNREDSHYNLCRPLRMGKTAFDFLLEIQESKFPWIEDRMVSKGSRIYWKREYLLTGGVRLDVSELFSSWLFEVFNRGDNDVELRSEKDRIGRFVRQGNRIYRRLLERCCRERASADKRRAFALSLIDKPALDNLLLGQVEDLSWLDIKVDWLRGNWKLGSADVADRLG